MFGYKSIQALAATKFLSIFILNVDFYSTFFRVRQVSYNRFVELESRVFFLLMFFLNLGAFGRCTGITFVDSTMIPVCHNLRRYANKVFKGIATDGKEQWVGAMALNSTLRVMTEAR